MAIIGGFPPHPWLIGAMVIGIGLSQVAIGFCIRSLWQKRVLHAQAWVLVASFVAGSLMYHVVLPNSMTPWISPRVYLAMRKIDPQLDRPLGDVFFDADSLVFFTKGRLERMKHHELTDWANEHSDGLVVWVPPEKPEDPAEYPEAARYADMYAEPPCQAEPIDVVRGFDYTRGRMIDARLFDAADLVCESATQAVTQPAANR
jgi:hypothetical protein